MNYTFLYSLHMDSGHDHVTFLDQQDISRQDSSRGLKSACPLGYPLLLAALRTHPQREKVQAKMHEEKPWTSGFLAKYPSDMGVRPSRTSQSSADVPMPVPCCLNSQWLSELLDSFPRNYFFTNLAKIGL